MKNVIVALSLVLFIPTIATADDVHVVTKKVNGDTMVICAIPKEMGKIEMAYINLSRINGMIPSGKGYEMELIGDSNAAFTLSGSHQSLEGKVKILLTDLSKKIIRKDFIDQN